MNHVAAAEQLLPDGETERVYGRVAVAGGCGAIGAEFATAIAPFFDTYVIDRDIERRTAWRERWKGDSALRILDVTDSFEPLRDAEFVVVTIGTEGATGDTRGSLPELLTQMLPHLSDNQLLMIRSTVSPGTTRDLARIAHAVYPDLDVVVAPERSLEGTVAHELFAMPQILGGPERAVARAARFFSMMGISVTALSDWESAELAKLMCNGYRYINFQVANHFEMLSAQLGCSYELIRQAVRRDYPRATGLAPAGFVGGPCLPKDTRLLAGTIASASHHLTSTALLNGAEYLEWVVSRLEEKLHGFRGRTIGVLGMGFKAGTTDRRASPSVQLAEALRTRGATVIDLDEPDEVSQVPMDCLVDVHSMLARTERPLSFTGEPANVYVVGVGWSRVE